MKKKLEPYQKYGLLIGLIIVLVLIFSFAAFFFLRSRSSGRHLTALVYQNGSLVGTVDLDTVTEACSLTLNGENGSYNIIEFRPGSVGITDADCPDRLCVHMGFQSSSLLPITCLPNRVVIRLAEEDASGIGTGSDAPDGITY